jgi:DNA invertase Pin-like site-specific DNA recombinase
LLSIFEQANFISEREETTKDYALSVDDPDVEAVLDILKHAAADAATRKELDEEAYYQRAMYGMFGKQYEKMEKQALKIAKYKRGIEEAKRKTEEADRKAEEFKKETEAANRREEELKRKFTLKLKRDGTPPAEIAELTGLSVGEIKKLQARHHNKSQSLLKEAV